MLPGYKMIINFSYLNRGKFVMLRRWWRKQKIYIHLMTFSTFLAFVKTQLTLPEGTDSSR